MFKFEQKVIDLAIQYGWLYESDDWHFPEWEIKAGYAKHIAKLIAQEWAQADEWDKCEFTSFILETYGDFLMKDAFAENPFTWQDALICRVEHLIFNHSEKFA